MKYFEVNENDRGFGLSHEMYLKKCKNLGLEFNEEKQKTIYLNSLIKNSKNDKYALIVNEEDEMYFPTEIFNQLKTKIELENEGWVFEDENIDI